MADEVHMGAGSFAGETKGCQGCRWLGLARQAGRCREYDRLGGWGCWERDWGTAQKAPELPPVEVALTEAEADPAASEVD